MAVLAGAHSDTATATGRDLHARARDLYSKPTRPSEFAFTVRGMEDTLLLDMFVPGKPEPQGSATAFVPEKNGRPIRRPGGSIVVNVTSDNPKLKGWRSTIEALAAQEWGERLPLEDASIAVECDFYLKRPEAHWGTGSNAHLLKDSAPAAPRTIPDVDKLLRAVLDGLTGIVYQDDALVTACPAEKHYAVPDGSEHQRQGVRVRVYRRAVQTASDLPPEQRVRVVPGAPPAVVDDDQLALV